MYVMATAYIVVEVLPRSSHPKGFLVGSTLCCGLQNTCHPSRFIWSEVQIDVRVRLRYQTGRISMYPRGP
jgi:hypothetical protein